MHNREQVLHHLLFGGERLGVHHHDLAPMVGAELLEELEAEAHQAVLVSDHDL